MSLEATFSALADPTRRRPARASRDRRADPERLGLAASNQPDGNPETRPCPRGGRARGHN